ncbi:hypothetical protein WQQ_28430 [Hydrocarboniphaga effusa AP103]|uniref:Uncharacterized protein n=1 Tax=Hydrocarboniphaga effusa AP103 TaxID=1172194 RepID=I8HZZ9_9GAMM|nr:hypothetical protein WQQ_28430 [Hydrocarboniphaga effusa AP103]
MTTHVSRAVTDDGLDDACIDRVEPLGVHSSWRRLRRRT